MMEKVPLYQLFAPEERCLFTYRRYTTRNLVIFIIIDNSNYYIVQPLLPMDYS